MSVCVSHLLAESTNLPRLRGRNLDEVLFVNTLWESQIDEREGQQRCAHLKDDDFLLLLIFDLGIHCRDRRASGRSNA